MKKKIVILFSGTGSNMKKIIESLRNELEIVCCITDKKDALGISIPKENGIDTFILKTKNYSQELIDLLKNKNIDLVIGAGFMRILSKEFVNKFKTINLHPSLLPRHRGLHAIEKSFNDEYSDAGITIHYMDEGVDTGKIVFQKKIEKKAKETFENFKERIKTLEHTYFSKIILQELNK